MGKIIGVVLLVVLLIMVVTYWPLIEGLFKGGTQYREYPQELEYTIARTITSKSASGYGFTIQMPVPDDIYTLDDGGGVSTYIQRIHSSEHEESPGVAFAAKEEQDIWPTSASNKT